MNGGNITESEFYCIVCGQKGIPIPRKRSQQRNKGHVKHLYCVHCKKETPHLERRECDYTLYNVLETLQSV